MATDFHSCGNGPATWRRPRSGPQLAPKTACLTPLISSGRAHRHGCPARIILCDGASCCSSVGQRSSNKNAAAELIASVDAKQRHVAIDLFGQQFRGVHDERLSADRSGVKKWSADKDKVGAKCQCLEHVRSATNATVKH